MTDLRSSWRTPPIIALQLLTRLPMPDVGVVDNPTLGRSLLWYPPVGLLIGGLLWLLAAGLNLLLPELWGVQAAIVLAGWCLLTGGLHIDGLADSADAWIGGFGDRERTLALMKDPTCGPAAVMLLVLVLLAKFALLEALLARGGDGLILVPLVARAAVLLLFLSTDYVREGGLASVLTAHFPRTLTRRWLWGWGALLLMFGAPGLWLLGLSLPVFFGLRRLMIRRIGGTTGDTAGAMVELVELAALLGLLVAAT